MSIPQRNTALVAVVAAVLVLPFLISAVGAGAGAENFETVDLADLADGETRTFGEGDDTIRATRDGDRVTVTLSGRDGEATTTRTLTCDVAADRCSMLVGTAGEGHSLFVLRSSGGGDGDERIERRVEIVTGEGDLPRVHAFRFGPEGVELEALRDLDVDLEGLADRLRVLRVPAPPVLVHAGPGETVLRCPEGDATITVDDDEADDVFLCPKHSVPMERFADPGEGHGFRWHMRVLEDEDASGSAPEL